MFRGIFAAALLASTSASAEVCLSGDPKDVLKLWMDHTGQKPILEMQIDTGGAPLPAMILADPKGDFTVLFIGKGHVCLSEIGHGMGPAHTDPQFPIEEPAKPEESP